MKFWLVALLGFAVNGCTTPKTVSATDYRGDPVDFCSIVAEQRMQDAAIFGHDDRTQKHVFVDVYADCKKKETRYQLWIDRNVPHKH